MKKIFLTFILLAGLGISSFSQLDQRSQKVFDKVSGYYVTDRDTLVSVKDGCVLFNGVKYTAELAYKDGTGYGIAALDEKDRKYYFTFSKFWFSKKYLVQYAGDDDVQAYVLAKK